MSVQILLRRGTAAQWTAANPILAAGEFGYETDTKKLKIGDGATAWTSLSYTGAENYIPKSVITAKGQIITGSSVSDYAVLPIGTAGQVIVEDVTANTLSYQTLSFSSLPDVNVTGATTNDLFSRGASTWDRTTFSAAFTGNETFTRDVIATRVGAAGYFSSTLGSSTVYKLSFPSDTFTTTTAAPDTLDRHASFSNNQVAVYMTRGFNSSFVETSTVYKWSMPAESVSTTTSTTLATRSNAAFSNHQVAGYISRGNGGGAAQTTVYKMSFPQDTMSTTTAAPAAMRFHSGTNNSGVAGYFSQGNNTTALYKWTFPADTVSTATAFTAALNNFPSAFANPTVAGYFARDSFTTTIYKYTFPTDVLVSTLTASAFFSGSTGFHNPTVAGYFNRSASNVATSLKFSFPTDTESVAVTLPVSSVNGCAGSSNV